MRSSTRTRSSVFDFVPTLINYAVVLLGWSRASIAIESLARPSASAAPAHTIQRQTIIDSIIVAVGSTAFTMHARGPRGLCPVAHAVQLVAKAILNWVLGAALPAADRDHRAGRLHVPLHVAARQSLPGSG
jgi:hypothetical protein